MRNKTVSNSFSKFVIQCLQNNDADFTSQKMASFIDEEEKFVEDILKGNQTFKIYHLQKIGKVCKKPLPLMLMKEIEKK